MSAADRIRALKEHLKLTKSQLSQESGISYNRLDDIINKRLKVRHEDLDALSKQYPRFEVWLHTGKEFPDHGQISPETEVTLRDYQPQKKDGS